MSSQSSPCASSEERTRDSDAALERLRSSAPMTTSRRPGLRFFEWVLFMGSQVSVSIECRPMSIPYRKFSTTRKSLSNRSTCAQARAARLAVIPCTPKELAVSL